jgi:predicted  nucleic acid-binding Zn-ribbon protein
MSWLFYPEVLALGSAAFCLLITLMLSFAKGVQYSIAYDKLPAATRWRELQVEVGSLEARRAEIDEDVRRKQAILSDLDKVESQYEYWSTQLELVKAEYAQLDEQRQEIAETRESYRHAIEELTIAETNLRQLRADADAAQVKVEKAANEVAEAETRLQELEEQGAKLKETFTEIEADIASVEGRLENLNNQKTATAIELERTRERLAALDAEHDSLERELIQLKNQKAPLESELASLQGAIAALPVKKAEIEKIQQHIVEITRKRESLDQSIEEKARAEHRLLARIANLEEELGATDGPNGPERDKQSLADLTKPPACLATERPNGVFDPSLRAKAPAEIEMSALDRVMQHLDESGLEFPRRTVSAFHTSLKTAVISPLTVLAGISGTGKSQLPRYYADAMGIHFLKIPVQPRWDGPQDLFGFYNYIEKRYKATDLARALVHLDHHNWPDLAAPYQDRMILVLLDEMNLARVEYYFSEFLSRLEGRPFNEGSSSEGDRRPSEIDIDVSRNGQMKRVYAGQNVLFVGTMNEDESTLSLSDKVLDRANVMRFPKPVELKDTLITHSHHHIAQGYLPKTTWMTSWMRSAEQLDTAQSERANRVIAKINNIMNDLGRPFGHRMGQAMLHYVANYPVAANKTNNTEPVNFGLADQIEQRIMPKLRGVVVDTYRRQLLDLADLAGQDLNDQALAEEIKKTVDRARDTNNLFVWRGFSRPA